MILSLRESFLLILLFVVWFCPSGELVAQDSQPENLGRHINTSDVEILPVISADGRTLFFCRRSHSDPGDIFFSTRNPDGSWAPAQSIGAPLNNSHANFVCSASPDGKTLLLGNVYTQNGSLKPGVSITRRSDSGWSFPEPLLIRNYYNHSAFSAFYLAGDETTLLMSLQRDDTHGETDLYVNFRQGDGTWSEPRNLGLQINTYADETTPFLASDGVSLYFSSKGHRGFGSNDVFVAKRLDESWQRWSAPANLGPGVNSSGWDAYYTIPASGDFAYFVSEKNSYGREDIFRIRIPDSLRPAPVVLITGRVLQSGTQVPLGATIYYETLPEGRLAGTARSDAKTGEYSIILPAGKKYGFRAEAENFVSVSQNLDLVNFNAYREISRDLMLVPVSAGQSARLNNIFFDSGRAELRDESSPELERLLALMKKFPAMELEIAGHTDDVGTPSENLRLSRERAEAVAQFLYRNGIDPARIRVRGYGQTRPLVKNSSEEHRAQNRRVEFTILKK